MKTENRFLYALKFIACLFVITIHAPFGGAFGDIVLSISRFAVPFFFAVSGRFLLLLRDGSVVTSPEVIRERVKKSLFKLMKMTAVVYLIHLCFSLAFNLLQGMSFNEWLTMKFNPFEARAFFMFNSGRFIYDGSYVFDHMWYLFALIYVYLLIIIFAPFLRKWYKGLIAILLFFLYFGELLQTYYPIRPFDISISTWYVLRNWLFVGIPFVLLGILFGDFADTHRKSMGKFRIPSFAAIAVGIILGFIEFKIFGAKEVYLGSLVIVTGLLFLSESEADFGGFLSDLGKRASSNAYFYHVLIIAVLDIMSQNGIIPLYTMWQKPLIVMAICTLVFGMLPLFIEKRRRTNE